MMSLFALILVIIWVVCWASGNTFGGFINALLIIALLLVLMQIFFNSSGGGEGGNSGDY